MFVAMKNTFPWKVNRLLEHIDQEFVKQKQGDNQLCKTHQECRLCR